MDRLLTVDQVADRLQVNEQTVRRWLRDGDLSGIAFGGRTGWRVSPEDLALFLEKRREDAETGKAAAGMDPADGFSLAGPLTLNVQGGEL